MLSVCLCGHGIGGALSVAIIVGGIERVRFIASVSSCILL